MGAYDALMDMLTVNTGIETLILDATAQLGGIHAELYELAKALTLNRTLKTIQINQNYIHSSGDMWDFMRTLSENSVFLPLKVIENGIESELQSDREFPRLFRGVNVLLERHFETAPSVDPVPAEKPTRSKKFGWPKKRNRQIVATPTIAAPRLVSELKFIFPDQG